jgi:hypothetical protein
MSYSSWVKNLLSLFVGLLIVIIGFNILIDPMEIFQTVSIAKINSEKTRAENYERLYKFYQINRFMPNTIILGSSRGKILQSKDIAVYTHDKVYNLSFGAATPYEQYQYALYCMEHFHLNNIILTTDFFSYNPSLLPAPDFNLERLNEKGEFASLTNTHCQHSTIQSC